MKYKVNFKTFSTKEKAEYIWEYYRWHILTLICTVTILASVVLNFITYKEPLLNVIMLNSDSSTYDTQTQGFEEFFKKYGYETFEGALEIKKDLYIHSVENVSYEEYQNYEVLLTLLMGGDYELLLGTGDIYQEIVNQGCLMDLSEVLSEELLERYEGQLIYFDDMGETEPYPCAVVLSGNQWLSENHYYYEECYFGLLKQANTSEIATRFAEFLLNY